MFQKAGKYFADWYDSLGARRRKSFSSKRAALLYEEEMREIARPKRPARGHASPRSSARNSNVKARAAGPHSINKPKNAPLSSAKPRPMSCVVPTLQKRSLLSKSILSRTPRK
jgi:hypothetical protein